MSYIHGEVCTLFRISLSGKRRGSTIDDRRTQFSSGKVMIEHSASSREMDGESTEEIHGRL